ncbi:ARM repeat-containing protein [Ramicandelaber brevisporus]|nr:ARM repeat-containing protein [Ramicandelaber brevisporus]
MTAEPRDQVLLALIASVSSEQTRLSQGETMLKALEAQLPAFYALLLEIVLDGTVDVDRRLLAAIHLKNGVERHWRPSSKKTIPVDTKVTIRGKILSALTSTESSSKLAAQCAVIVAKIARLDYPREWPTLLDELAQCVQQAQQSVVANPVGHAVRIFNQLMITLHQVVRELASKALPADKRSFAQCAPQLLELVAAIYMHHFGVIEAASSSSSSVDALGSPAVLASMEACRMSLKIIRRLLIYGYTDISGSAQVAQAWSALAQHLPKYAALRITVTCSDIVAKGGDIASYLAGIANDEEDETDVARLTRRLIKFATKIFTEMREHRPRQFFELPFAVDVLQFYWTAISSPASLLPSNSSAASIASIASSAPATALISEQFVLLALGLWRDVISGSRNEDSYATSSTPMPEAQTLLLERLLTAQAVADIVKFLVMVLIRFNQHSDLASWEDSSEEWLAEEEARHYDFNVRAGAINLLLTLAQARPEDTAAAVMAHVTSVASLNIPSMSLDDVLTADAIMCALGLLVDYLYEQVQLDNLFTGFFQPGIAAFSDVRRNVFKYRAAWIVSRWVTVKLSEAERQIVYSLLLEMSLRNEPFIVRYQAISTLRDCIDDWDFNAEAFVPQLDCAVANFAGLLQDASLPETQMRVLNMLSVLSGRMMSHIAPYAETIIALLPPIWESSGQHDQILQASVIQLLTALVQSLGSISVNAHGLVAPLIVHGVDPASPGFVYLAEDSLELWKALVQRCPSDSNVINGPLGTLLSFIPGLLTNTTETMQATLTVLESYVMLAPEQIANAPIIAQLLSSIKTLLGNVRHNAVSKIIRVVDSMTLLMPVEPLAQALSSSGLSAYLLTELLTEKDINSRDSTPSYVLAHYLCIYARIALRSPAVFFNLLSQHAAANGIANETVILEGLMARWSACRKAVTSNKQTKLTAMGFLSALCHALPLSQATMAAPFSSVVQVCMQILDDIGQKDGGSNADDLADDSVVYRRGSSSPPPTGNYHEAYDGFEYDEDDGADGAFDEEAMQRPEVLRYRAMITSDPVHSVAFGVHIRNSLLGVAQTVGMPSLASLLTGLSQDYQQRLSKILS